MFTERVYTKELSISESRIAPGEDTLHSINIRCAFL